MKGRRHPLLVLVAAFACLFTQPGLVWPQIDPLELQARAIQRIDTFLAEFRTTGNPRVAHLVQADAELAESNRLLLLRGNWSALAPGLIKRGSIYRMQSQWAPAVDFYRQAEEAAKRGRDVVRQSDALAWRALAESSRRNFGQALADATLAVQLAETFDDADVFARALDVLASVQAAQGNLAAAADTVNREATVAARAKDPVTPYFAHLNRQDIYLKTAERCDFQRSFDPCYQAIERARADGRQAIDLARKLGYAALVRQSEQLLGDVDARAALIKSQESMHRTVQSMKIFHPTQRDDVLVTDHFVAPRGEVPAAVRQIYEAWKRFERQAGGYADVVEARSLYVEGLMNEARGNNDEALSFYLKSVDTLESDRRALRDERSRGTFLENRIDFYHGAIQQLLEHHRDADAFELLERSRSRALADLLASRKLGLGRPEEQQLYTESTVLRTRIGDLQGQLFELASQPDAAKHRTQMAELQTQIRTLENQYRQVASRIATEAPRLQTLVTSQPVTLKALQASMRDERYEMLQYLVVESAVIVWHITADSIYVRSVFLPRSEVMAKTAALQKTLADRNAPFDETTARELYLYLIAPIASRIRSERLVIVPHEDLQYIPFQVLLNPEDGRFVGERYQITYAPSAAIFLGLRRPRGLSGARLLAVADPDITAADREVRGIATLFPAPAKVIVDDLAREHDIKEWTRDYDVVHLAVHGKFDGAEPMLSYLSLASGGGDDGRLTAAEMFGLPLLNSRLVVLSACETGRAEATHGNEVLGMIRALLYAGAGTLVLSHWEVDSAPTAVWMQSFYQAALTRPMPEAARAALVTVKSNPSYRHPHYWAAFAVVSRW